MEAQDALETAVYYERRQVWHQTIKSYEKVFRVIPRIEATSQVNTTRLKVLIYECHYHCGVAYQRMLDHRKAITHFSKAMHVISARKDACSAGCITGRVLHLHVPVLVRISMCQVHLGSLREALEIADQAIVLDFSNADLFCARALVHYLSDSRKKAAADVSFAIKLSPNHVLAWLLRGLFQQLQETSYRFDGRAPRMNRDLVKACDIDADALVFLGIKNLQDNFQSLFDRFLPSIRMPHTLLVKDIFDGDFPKVAPARLPGRRVLSCKDLNRKLESRLEERKRESARTAQLPADQVPCELRSLSRKVGSGLASGGLVCSTHCRDAHAQPKAFSTSAYVPRSRITLGDVLWATRTRSRRLDNLQHPVSGLGDAHNSGDRDDHGGQGGVFIGERMYPKSWEQDRISTTIPAVRGCRKLPYHSVRHADSQLQPQRRNTVKTETRETNLGI